MALTKYKIKDISGFSDNRNAHAHFGNIHGKDEVNTVRCRCVVRFISRAHSVLVLFVW